MRSDLAMEPSTRKTNSGKTLFARFAVSGSRRLTTTFVLMGTLSVGILAGSVLTRNVSGKEQQAVDSSDARPLIIPNPASLSNGFSEIVKQVGPAVVNINTEELPKSSTTLKHKRNPHGPIQQDPNGDDDNGDDSQQQPPGDMQDFFNRFFGGQGGDGGDDNGDGGSRRALGSGF